MNLVIFLRYWVELSLSNVGIGMTVEQQAKLLEGIQPSRHVDSAPHRLEPCHQAEARAHDGRRRYGQERTG